MFFIVIILTMISNKKNVKSDSSTGEEMERIGFTLEFFIKCYYFNPNFSTGEVINKNLVKIKLSFLFKLSWFGNFCSQCIYSTLNHSTS